MNLQQFLAKAGVASRRKAAHLIETGQVEVGGKRVTEMGVRVDPARDEVRVGGRRVVPERPAYVLLHKPRGVITSLSDPVGRRTVGELVASVPARVVPVGRLDFDTDGVLLLTNDGDLANALLHPSRRVERVYHAKLDGHVSDDDIQRLRRGVRLEDGPARADRVRPLGTTGKHAWLEIVLHEGRNRQIHRMAREIGHDVLKLSRVRFAGLHVDNVPPGQWRELSRAEVAKLKALVSGRAEPRERGNRAGARERRRARDAPTRRK